MLKVYFYSKPYFLYIDSESLVDADLTTDNGKNYFDLQYTDDYFTLILKKSKKKKWLIFLQSFDENNIFISQSNLGGENLKLKRIDGVDYLTLQYDQITNNKIWPSLPPTFDEGEIEYKNAKLSHYRDKKLKKIIG